MGIIQRAIAVLLALVFVAAVLIFASLALGILVAVGIVVWGWLWWRSRSAVPPPSRGGAVVEGEYRDLTPTERRSRPMHGGRDQNV